MNKNKFVRIAVVFIIMFLLPFQMKAQQQKKGSERLQNQLREYITKAVTLTEAETDSFFLLNNELLRKKLSINSRIQQIAGQHPADDAQSRKLLEESDSLKIKMKELDMDYHIKMMEALPPKKVFEILNAETKFFQQNVLQLMNKQNNK